LNCCNDYGECEQGEGCPARASHMDENRASKEAGNVWFYEPPPVELTTLETVIVYCTLTILSLISLGLVSAGTLAIFSYFFA